MPVPGVAGGVLHRRLRSTPPAVAAPSATPAAVPAPAHEASPAPTPAALDFVTILRSNKVPASKHWGSSEKIEPETVKPLWWRAEQRPVNSIAELSALLLEIEADPYAAVIRGRLRDDWREIVAKHMPHWSAEYARKHGGRTLKAPAGEGWLLRRTELFEEAAHRWVLLDVDGYPCLLADPVAQPAEAVADFIDELPAEFNGAAHHIQLSNSAGLAKHAGKLKAHVWFWVDRPLNNAQLKAWAAGLKGEVDAALFDEVQLHYTAGPTFAPGVADPVPVRSLFVEGRANVQLELSPHAANAKPIDKRKQLVDPRRKPGVVGAFCRAFTVEQVIERFLPEQFTFADGSATRLTWHGGNGAAEGAYVSEDRLGIGAMHNSWPWGSGRRANLFDLVRFFMFGHLDEGLDALDAAGAEAHIEQRPSHEAMVEWCKKLSEVQAELDRAHQHRDRDDLEEARRLAQIDENKRIGAGEHTVPRVALLTLGTAIERFVLVADGGRVADILAPHFDLAYENFASKHAASRVQVPAKRPDGKPKLDRDGNAVTEEVPIARVWLAHPDRKTVDTRTFKAGGPLTLLDPNGRLALNSWRPYDRSVKATEADEQRAHELFIGHVQWLFGEATEPFLDWLAHIEQQPGVLPHTAWLHVAQAFGLGRNWLCSVLTRLWAGKTAANVDLVGLLNSSFNGMLAGKVLAFVDEIREGGGGQQWKHAETLKSLITAEHRQINPKYGRQSIEFNACRWLLLSNHDSAIPIDRTDRRIEVAKCSDGPRSADYYTHLYTAVGDPRFLAGVAAVLAERDISRFNPGARARLTTAKLDVVAASRTTEAERLDLLLAHWPSDLIKSSDLAQLVAGGGSLLTSHRHAIRDAGIVSFGVPRRVGRSALRLSVLRNFDAWREASGPELQAELSKVDHAMKELGGGDAYLDPGELLDQFAAETEQ
jgi:hypothetical protein